MGNGVEIEYSIMDIKDVLAAAMGRYAEAQLFHKDGVPTGMCAIMPDSSFAYRVIIARDKEEFDKELDLTAKKLRADGAMVLGFITEAKCGRTEEVDKEDEIEEGSLSAYCHRCVVYLIEFGGNVFATHRIVIETWQHHFLGDTIDVRSSNDPDGIEMAFIRAATASRLH